jgi:hypothetical protein
LWVLTLISGTPAPILKFTLRSLTCPRITTGKSDSNRPRPERASTLAENDAGQQERNGSIVSTEVDLAHIPGATFHFHQDCSIVGAAADVSGNAGQLKSSVMRLDVQPSAHVGNGNAAVMRLDFKVGIPWDKDFALLRIGATIFAGSVIL